MPKQSWSCSTRAMETTTLHAGWTSHIGAYTTHGTLNLSRRQPPLMPRRVTRDLYGDFVATMHPFLIERSGFEMIELDRPAPVFTCWNGILVTHAEPFIPPELRPRNHSVLSARPLAKKLAWTHPAASEHSNTPPRDLPTLKFRAAGQNECFSSVRVCIGRPDIILYIF